MKLLRYIAISALAATSFVACADDTVQTGEEQNVTQRTGGEVELYRSAADSQYRFRVKAANGQIILASEGYVGKAGAMRGLESAVGNARSVDNFELRAASSNADGRADGEWYFVLKAGNGEILGVSEIYDSKSNAKRGFKTVAGYVLGGLTIDNWADNCGFELYEGADEQLYFRLRADNGENMLRSEGYGAEASAKGGVDAVINNGMDESGYAVKEAADGRFYFNVVAGNNEVVATSDMYASQASAEDGVAVVQRLVSAQASCASADSGRELECSYSIEAAMGDDAQELEDSYSVSETEIDVSNISSLDTLSHDQVRVAIQYQIDDLALDFIQAPDEERVWLHQVDYDGTGYDWVQFYLGDTEVGVLFADDSLDIVALVGDGDIYGCR